MYTFYLHSRQGAKIRVSPSSAQVGAVVVGFDRYVNYYKIQYATLCIRENPGCMFIATNRDAVTHLTDAQEWAGGCGLSCGVRVSVRVRGCSLGWVLHTVQIVLALPHALWQT